MGVFRCLDQRNRLIVLVGQWRFERPREVNHSKTEDGRGPFYREIKGGRERDAGRQTKKMSGITVPLARSSSGVNSTLETNRTLCVNYNQKTITFKGERTQKLRI